MSDAALDAAYEQNIRRCRDQGHRLFFFFVNNAEVAVCPRCDIRFIEDVTAGDGSEWDQQVRDLATSMALHPAGKSASGTITCCEPLWLRKPSGAYFGHSRFCKESPEEKIDTSRYSQGREWHLRGRRR